MDSKLIKAKILSGEIKTFPELISYTSYDSLAQVMGCSTNHVMNIERDSGEMKLGELFKLCEYLDMTRQRWRVAEMFVGR